MEEKFRSETVSQNQRRPFFLFAISLFVLFFGGLFWLFLLSPQTPIGFGWFLFSFAAGLSMIVLPCTLPLVFVIVPLSMGKSPGKGLSIALAFGIGVALTLSIYGILAAILGKVVIGTLDAPLETVKNWMYMAAGLAAFLFALGELKLLRIRMPAYSGAAPMFIQKQGDILKAFFLGLFMGNIGVGCPHPATPVILTRIAISGDIFYGWLLFLVHAIGRIIPLILLVVLGFIGINAISALVKRREAIERATGWAMVYVAAFIFVLGLFTHDWWVLSGQHSFLEKITQEALITGTLAERFGVEKPHAHGIPEGQGLFGLPLWLGTWVLVFLWVIPLWWHWFKEKKRVRTLSENEKIFQLQILEWKKWFFVAIAAFIAVTFLYTLPQWFLQKAQVLEIEETQIDYQVQVSTAPELPLAGQPTKITIALKDKEGRPLKDLQVAHERILHAVIISEDLKEFAHKHHEDENLLTQDIIENAVFSITLTFPKAQKYLVGLDFRHEGKDASSLQYIEVLGLKEPILIEKDLNRKKNFQGYDVKLSSDPGELKSGEETHLNYFITKEGKEVTDLQYYLGEPMHFSMVSADLGTFLHTHGELPGQETPEDHEGFIPVVLANGRHDIREEFKERQREISPSPRPSQFGPEIEAHIVFEYPGIYKIFGEFQHQDKVVLTEFMVVVKPRTSEEVP